MKSQQPVLPDYPLSPELLENAFQLKKREEEQEEVRREFTTDYSIEPVEEV